MSCPFQASRVGLDPGSTSLSGYEIFDLVPNKFDRLEAGYILFKMAVEQLRRFQVATLPSQALRTPRTHATPRLVVRFCVSGVFPFRPRFASPTRGGGHYRGIRAHNPGLRRNATLVLLSRLWVALRTEVSSPFPGRYATP